MRRSIFKLPASLLKKYNNSLIISPYRTKMATAGFTYFLADYICQSSIEKRDLQDYSSSRSLRQASVGAFFAAPSLHVWHSIILPKVVKSCTKNDSSLCLSFVEWDCTRQLFHHLSLIFLWDSQNYGCTGRISECTGKVWFFFTGFNEVLDRNIFY